jgi:hypothetical protein
MPTFPSNFEPNKASLHKWFGTRKKPMVFGAVELPGVFQTHAYSNDTLKVSIILILEAVGAYAIMYEGGFVFLSVIPVLFAIIIDIYLAIQLHSYVPKRLELKNRAKAETDPAIAAKFEQQSKQGLATEGLIKFAIYLLGTLKGIAYFLYVGAIDPQVILMIVIFLIIASLHISTTGYWVAEFMLKQSIKKQVEEHILNPTTTPNRAIERMSTFNADSNIRVINIGLHKLEKSEVQNEYKLITVGVLTDNDLAAIVAVQPSVNLQSVVASACIKHQIQNILLG